MRGLLTMLVALGAVVAGLFGLTAISEAKSAIHEIEALICLLVLTIACSAGMIVCAIDESKPKVATKPVPPPVPSVKS